MTERVFDHRTKVADPTRRGDAIIFAREFEVPADAPPSFKSSGTCIQWFFEIRIPRRGMDWTDQFHLEVLP